MGPERILQQRHQQLARLLRNQSPRSALNARIARQLRLTDRDQQPVEEVRRPAGDEEPEAIARLKEPVDRDEPLRAHRRGPTRQRRHFVRLYPANLQRGRAAKLRHFEPLPHPPALPSVETAGNRRRPHRRAAVARQRQHQVGRITRIGRLVRHDPADRRDQRRRGRAVDEWTALSKRRHRHVNQRGIRLTQRRLVEASRHRAPLRDVDHHNICRARKKLRAIATRIARRIQHHRPLTSIEGLEARRHAVWIAARRLNLDHVGAVVGQEHRRVWTSDPACEVNDSNVIEDRRLVLGLVEIGRIGREFVHHLRSLRLAVKEV